jgi:hypothetical protein
MPIRSLFKPRSLGFILAFLSSAGAALAQDTSAPRIKSMAATVEAAGYAVSSAHFHTNEHLRQAQLDPLTYPVTPGERYVVVYDCDCRDMSVVVFDPSTADVPVDTIEVEVGGRYSRPAMTFLAPRSGSVTVRALMRSCPIDSGCPMGFGLAAMHGRRPAEQARAGVDINDLPEWQKQVGGRLLAQAVHRGYALLAGQMQLNSALQYGDHSEARFALDAGETVWLEGACEACSALLLSVFDASGAELARDPGEGALPRPQPELKFSAPASGLYTVRMTMSVCSGADFLCDAAFGAFKPAPAAQSSNSRETPDMKDAIQSVIEQSTKLDSSLSLDELRKSADSSRKN